MFPLSSNASDGIYATRLYLFLLVASIAVLVSYASISVRVQSMTVYQPSLSEYNQLYVQYPLTLVCPCTRLSLPYASIISIKPRYHQVCSSDFIKDDVWILYFNLPANIIFSIYDFRSGGIHMFSILQTLCKMANETVMNELAVFNDTKFVTARVLSSDTFNIQTAILVQQFQQQVCSIQKNQS